MKNTVGKKVGIAVIGCGTRARWVVHELVKAAGDKIELLSAYDPDPRQLENSREQWGKNNPVYCKTYQEAIATPGVSWVMVFSPNACHREHIVAAFKAGKHVFSEKPLATSIRDCQAIYDAHKNSGLRFATGFVLRYSPLYRKIKDILDSGELGDLLAISADENITVQHGTYIMRNWRRHTGVAGPHILEKCCHDLDLLEWFTGSLPTHIMAMADRLFFTPERAGLLKKFPPDTLMVKQNQQQIDSPFTDDSDVDDTLFSISRFRNGVIASFSATMCNALPERRIRFHCEVGTLTVEFYTMTIRYHFVGESTEQLISFGNCSEHGGGDSKIMGELWDSMRNHTQPKCSGSEGLRSAVFALAVDQAAHEHRTVELEEVWRKLGC